MNGPINAELLGRLLDEHGAALALYASQWTDSPDDCVQEALVELARQPQKPRHVAAWLYRVVKNRALNAARGARRRREREARVMAERFIANQQSAAFDRDDSRAAIEALEQLDLSERELVVMRIWGGLKYEEIAEALAISISSAHRQYAWALVKLRKILETPCSTNTNRQNPS
ncbi:MAG TPA: sigma-70 family RNA polymerase sigma factor [Lacipirellulaceae bacterium]|jgi:RNA polymerase sigma-70 factor (ECF subfamily)|nr:sigma-70 family RNA polymerase sigma factor [Lacipirellulaceae bacterium]